jgi:DNA-binding LytR/AlgR family response regulator
VVAQARNGREAVELFEARRRTCASSTCTCRAVGRRGRALHRARAHLVFVTAFDQYAVEAFARGALDYLVKPVEPARLAETVARLQERCARRQPAATRGAARADWPRACARTPPAPPLQWLRASSGRRCA